jgi:hypothetical protein
VNALSLANSVEPVSIVIPYDTVGFFLHQRPRPFSYMLPYKLVELDLAQETNSLGILSGCVGQSSTHGKFPDLWLCETSQRKHGFAKLLRL